VKLIDFDYQKADGKVSTRSVAVLKEPCNFYEGLDLGELDNDELADFTVEFTKLYDEFLEQQQAVFNKYDLKFKYRRFIPDRMKMLCESNV
jgi:hypothetical protein